MADGQDPCTVVFHIPVLNDPIWRHYNFPETSALHLCHKMTTTRKACEQLLRPEDPDHLLTRSKEGIQRYV